MPISRRNFLKTSLSSMAYLSASSTVPLWITRSAQALCNTPNRNLVIIQQAGGNDGLNTVIPYTDPIYTGSQLLNGQEIRPNLKILEEDLGLTKLPDGLNAFHPKLVRLHDWYMNGNMAIIQNVGYPNPHLSHFQSTGFWERGSSPGAAQGSRAGWVARFFDNKCQGIPTENIDSISMLEMGRGALPPTMDGSLKYTPPTVKDFDSYVFKVSGNSTLADHQLQYMRSLNDIATVDPLLDFVHRTGNIAEASVDDMAVAAQIPSSPDYPEGPLGEGLSMVSRVIRAGFPTRIFFVAQGGYDNHARQFANGDPANFGDHADLLDEFDRSVGTFMQEMSDSGQIHRTMVMTFSEFGRRLAENGSKGTDHGAGNSLMVLSGRALNGGVYAGQPDLANPLNQNLRHTVDFRSVYSRIIQDWFDSDPVAVFGSDDFFDPILKINSGMGLIPFINREAFNTPASNGYGKLAAASIAAAAGALAIRRLTGRT